MSHRVIESLAGGDLADQAHALLEQQRQTWEMCRRGYDALATVRTRRFDFDGDEVLAQFNPGRIASSTAKVDAKSIQERPCFLCEKNLPREQRAIASDADVDYLILVNPFPIFPEHFTIAHRTHTPQRIADTLPAMLSLAKALAPRYTVLYNGPRCGASAPDHLHFQAGLRQFLPIDHEYDVLRSRRLLRDSDTLRIVAVDSGVYGRGFITIESIDAAQLSRAFQDVYQSMHTVMQAQDEPLMNLLASYESPRWRLIVFPRARHRPSFYSAEGDQKLLLSPAAVEMGGVCTLPVERDFERLTRQHIKQMYREVSLSPETFEKLCDRISQL